MILSDKKIYENVSVYNIMYKIPTVFQIVLIIILERSELTNVILYLLKNIDFS